MVPTTGSTWQGIWIGTIGAEGVAVCFGKVNDNGARWSRYYYLRHGEMIPLVTTDSQGGISPEDAEQKTTGSWTIDVGADGNLLGTWTSSEKDRSLPIHLSRVKLVANSEESFWLKSDMCRSISFYRPLAEHAELVAGATKTDHGHRYRLIAMKHPLDADKNLVGPEADFVEIDGHDPGIDAINHALRERYLNRLAKHYDKETGGLGEFFENVIGFTGKHVILDEYEWAAGYGVSGITRWTETWSLKTGKLIGRAEVKTGPDPEPDQ